MQNKTRWKTALQLFGTTSQLRTPIVGKATLGSLMATAYLGAALLSSGTAFSQEIIVGLAIDAEGKVGIGTDAPTSTLDVEGDLQTTGDITSYGEITSADGNISNDLYVGGSITSQVGIWSHSGYIRDDLSVGRDITSTGNLDVGGDITSTGDIQSGDGLFFYRYYKEYSAGVHEAGNSADSKNEMGRWDFCFLTKVKFAGIDNGLGDKATCEVIVSDKNRRSQGPSWTLYARVRDDVNFASCRAVCMSFTGQCTGSGC